MVMKNSLSELMKSDGDKKGMTERQINIINAAIEIFSHKGYEATTTSEIAKKAGVAEGTIFRYYKTKKDLLLAIPECLAKLSLSQVFLDDIDEIFNKEYEKIEDFLRNAILNRQKFASENMHILKIIFQEIPFHPELRDKIFNTVFLPTISKFIKIIDKFKEEDQIIDAPSTFIVQLMFTSVFGYFFSRYVARFESNIEEKEEIEYLIQYILNGIRKMKT